MDEITPEPTSSRKTPAWEDADDTELEVSLTSHPRLRKLRDAPTEDAVGGREYERRLRRQFEKINPTPTWANNARRKLHPKTKRPHLNDDSDTGDESDAFENILSSTNGIISGKGKSKSFESGILAIERLRDANQAAVAEGSIKTVQFHPSPRVPVLLAASSDRRARLFNVCFLMFI